MKSSSTKKEDKDKKIIMIKKPFNNFLKKGKKFLRVARKRGERTTVQKNQFYFYQVKKEDNGLVQRHLGPKEPGGEGGGNCPVLELGSRLRSHRLGQSQDWRVHRHQRMRRRRRNGGRPLSCGCPRGLAAAVAHRHQFQCHKNRNY